MPGFLDYGLERTVAPTAEPLTLATAKHQCNVEPAETAFDCWFNSGEGKVGAIQAARELVEQRAQLALMPQTWVLKLAEFPAEHPLIDLRIHPVRRISSVAYIDANGSTQTWSSSNYEVQRTSHRSLLVKTDTSAAWPTTAGNKLRPVIITMIAGYSDPTTDKTPLLQRAKVPAHARQAILMLLDHWFEHRGAVLVGMISKSIELSFEALIDVLRPTRYC